MFFELMVYTLKIRNYLRVRFKRMDLRGDVAAPRLYSKPRRALFNSWGDGKSCQSQNSVNPDSDKRKS
jgi:hypothetical protein